MDDAQAQTSRNSMAAIIQAAVDLTGDAEKALWYRSEPLTVFGDATAEHLVAEGRANDVLRYLASLQAGAAG
jgi:uncharacterized protein (DUF2384 family)